MKLFTEALDVREIDSSDWFRFFSAGWLLFLFCCLRCHCLLVFFNELLAVSIGLEDFCDVLLLLFKFCIVGDNVFCSVKQCCDDTLF